MAYYEAKGGTRKDREVSPGGPHHIRVYGAYRKTRDGEVADGWLVEHHSSADDRNPKMAHFEDGDLLMDHIREHATGVSSTSGRAPRESDMQGNLAGRGGEQDGQE